MRYSKRGRSRYKHRKGKKLKYYLMPRGGIRL